MTAQPDHGAAPIPRPEHTPDAVRVALARIAPHRLAELEQHKENALAAAIRSWKVGHLTLARLVDARGRDRETPGPRQPPQ